MALTDAQRSEIRLYLGWTPRYGQSDNALERAMNAIETFPTDEALITNAIDGDPPGILVSLKVIDAELISAHPRLKADNVGTLKLNRSEMRQLRKEGTRLVGRLSGIMGVEVRGNPYATYRRGYRASAQGPRNYVGQG